MAFGGEILRSDGSYWLTPDQTPLNLVSRQDQYLAYNTGIVYYNTGVSSSRPCCVFMRVLSSTPSGSNSQRNTAGYLIQRNGTWQYQLNGIQGNLNVRWYVFSNYVAITQPYDIAYYNAAGVQTWNGSSRPLQVFRRNVTKAQALSGGTLIDEGQPLAVTPMFSGDQVEGLLPGVPEIYLNGTYCYKAQGNQIMSDLVDVVESTAGPANFYIGTFFYIRTTLYDL